MKKLKFIPCLLLLMLNGCNYFRTGSAPPNTTAYNLEAVKSGMQPISLQTPPKPTEEIRKYFAFYDLNPPNVRHFFGTVESEGTTLAMHVFQPPNQRGTLFLIHGYFDHTGTLSKLIHEGLRRNYSIVVWDLPGHGLSSGARTDIGEFNLCALQFADLVQRTAPYLPGPRHLIAHSTGCSIALEYLYSADTNDFDQVTFLAPLVRHESWGWAKFGYTIAKPFKKSIRRRAEENSSDEAYMAFVKADPLHSSILSFNYLAELYAWEKELRDYPVLPVPIRIIQGDQDNVVDWQYNLELLRSKTTDPDIHIIEGANHQLCNERAELREQVFELIFDDER